MRTDRSLETLDIDTLIDRTEGWPIAVQLASLSIKRGVAAERVIDEYCGSSSDLARYMSEQVLMTLPQETREVVVRTALGDRLTGGPRSEEHTSELQSRMGTEYAPVCLNKKKHRSMRNKQQR